VSVRVHYFLSIIHIFRRFSQHKNNTQMQNVQYDVKKFKKFSHHFSSTNKNSCKETGARAVIDLQKYRRSWKWLSRQVSNYVQACLCWLLAMGLQPLHCRAPAAPSRGVVVITALHWMHGGLVRRKFSVCPSKTRELWQNGRKICEDFWYYMYRLREIV